MIGAELRGKSRSARLCDCNPGAAMGPPLDARLKHTAMIVFLAAGVVATAAAGAANTGWNAYQHGDYALARTLYESAARNGDRLAQYNLAMMQIRAEGGSADADAGVYWLRKASEAGMAQAQYNLGLLYETGMGVPRSL